jgi:hypothetical protein
MQLFESDHERPLRGSHFRTASARFWTGFAKAASVPCALKSIHCDSLKKYSRAVVNGAASVRSAMIGRLLEDARSTSFPT